MMPVSRFAAELPGRDRCLVVHPGNPPYLLPVAELVPAPFTAAEAVERTHDLLAAPGWCPVLVRHEVEGFVFNRLQGALLREAYRLVRDGSSPPRTSTAWSATGSADAGPSSGRSRPRISTPAAASRRTRG